MPKTHPIPQLSIVVPLGRDLAGFESTLISVLENQPDGSEVLVPHDGSYDDPFDLCEEVRFVVASSSNTLDLVGAAATQARGRFVHVLAEGIRATCGWTDQVLECFDHFDTGVVAPVIRSAANQRILAAGWSDGSSRLCRERSEGSLSPPIPRPASAPTCRLRFGDATCFAACTERSQARARSRRRSLTIIWLEKPDGVRVGSRVDGVVRCGTASLGEHVAEPRTSSASDP